MKIYFTVSLSQSTSQIQTISKRIVDQLNHLGHKNLHETIFEKNSEYYKNQSEEDSLMEQKNLTRWKNEADIIIIDVTKPSIGIGQELAYSLSLNKPVICLFNEEITKIPHILIDQAGESMLFQGYNRLNLEGVLKQSIDTVKKFKDIRFNMFLSREFNNYLNKVSAKNGISKAGYVRNLIVEDIRNNS